MSNDKIKTLLVKLHDELEATEVDDDTRSLIRALDKDIHDLINPDTEQNDAGPIVETANKLDAEFAAKHPLAERIVREIVETLARMGV